MIRKKNLIQILVVITLLFLTGCNSNEGLSDDSTKEAKTERALMSLDKNDYNEAASLFKELTDQYPNDNQLKGYYSSALAGQAGLDTFNLMKTIDSLNDNSSSNDTIELVGRTLTGKTTSDPTLTGSDVSSKSSMFELAMDALLKISGTTYTGTVTTRSSTARAILANSGLDKNKFNNDELVQLGLMAINHAILTMADIIFQDNKNLTKITLTETGIKEIYKDNPMDLTNITTYITENKLLYKLSIDIELIGYAIDAISSFMNQDNQGSNDIKDQFNEFKNKIDPNGDNDITQAELESYINSL